MKDTTKMATLARSCTERADTAHLVQAAVADQSNQSVLWKAGLGEEATLASSCPLVSLVFLLLPGWSREHVREGCEVLGEGRCRVADGSGDGPDADQRRDGRRRIEGEQKREQKTVESSMKAGWVEGYTDMKKISSNCTWLCCRSTKQLFSICPFLLRRMACFSITVHWEVKIRDFAVACVVERDESFRTVV